METSGRLFFRRLVGRFDGRFFEAISITAGQLILWMTLAFLFSGNRTRKGEDRRDESRLRDSQKLSSKRREQWLTGPLIKTYCSMFE